MRHITNVRGIVTNIWPLDSVLIINKTSTSEHVVEIRSKASGKVLKEAFKVGKGANEVFGSFKCGIIDSTFWSFEAQTRKVRMISLKRLLSSQNDEFKTYSFNLPMCYDIAPITADSTFIVVGDIKSQNKISIFDKNLKRIAGKGDYNGSFVSGTDLVYKKSAYSGNINIFPDQQRFLVSYLYSDVLELYNKNGDLLKALHGPDHFDPEPLDQVAGSISFTYNNHTKLSYLNSQVTSKYIYCLYSGQTVDNLYANTGKYLFVFDIKGNAVKAFKLTERIYAFGVDKDNSKLYAVSMQTGDLMEADINLN
jgi:hypothetical protein